MPQPVRDIHVTSLHFTLHCSTEPRLHYATRDSLSFSVSLRSCGIVSFRSCSTWSNHSLKACCCSCRSALRCSCGSCLNHVLNSCWAPPLSHIGCGVSPLKGPSLVLSAVRVQYSVWLNWSSASRRPLRRLSSPQRAQ